VKASGRNAIAIDTSGSFCSVAATDAAGHITTASSVGSGDHFEQLPRIVEKVCADSGLAPESFSEIRIGIGPGSFTGLRIGMSFAKGLAWSLRVPLVGYSSMAGAAAVAFARYPSIDRVAVVADARRDEAFAGVYRRGLSVEEEVAPHIVGASVVRESLGLDGATPVVSGQIDFALLGVDVTAESEIARGLLGLKNVVMGGYKVEEIAVLEPTYLREVAAKTIEERKGKA
jgi:tRNA threonylcarbamoyladenosine biosynthesis protein TsaB